MKDSRLESNPAIIRVSSPADIDTCSHAVIEASAGTGKTYTISGLVMRLVGEEGVSISQVLVVTFTEKATGELRQRIHDDMASALESGRFQWSERFGASGPAGWKTRFRQAVENFQEARIFTIHGFCQRTLREYAMESDSAFDLELVDDMEVFEKCMNRLKRRWSMYPDIREKFQESGYSAHAWDQAIISLASRYHPDFTLLEPEPLPEQAVRERFARVLEIVRPEPGKGIEDQPFYTMYQGLNFNKRSRGVVLAKVVTPMLECLCGYLKGDYSSPLSCIADIKDQCMNLDYGRFNSDGFLCLCPAKWNKNADQSALPMLRELGEILEVLSVQRLAFLIQAIRDLYQEAAEWKESRGLMSFDDMITRLHQGLDPSRNPNAPAFVSELRRSYRFCLVDEAQDTDPVQAAIFQRIFLHDSERTGCRLLVIGDPKQAIYGFRGADVNAYLSMKAGMREHGAKMYNLPVNFRALPDLTYSLNLLFKGDHWFPDAESAGYADISFIPSESQDDFQAGFRKENVTLLLNDHLVG
jgi:exodeoxyribonuclease V beta subunit